MLNYTLHITRNSILLTLSLITIILCVMGYYKRKELNDEEKFKFKDINFLDKIKFPQDNLKIDKLMSIVLVITIILSVSMTSYAILKPKDEEKFTELYLLGPNGNMSDYPTNLTAGGKGNLIIGIVNHENSVTKYYLLIKSNGRIIDNKTLTLRDNQRLEEPYTFTSAGGNKRELEFQLLKHPDYNNVYRSVHIWI